MREVAAKLEIAVSNELHRLIEKFSQVKDLLGDRKTFALAIKDDPDKGSLFLLADNKVDRVTEAIWKSVKPDGKQYVYDPDA